MYSWLAGLGIPLGIDMRLEGNETVSYSNVLKYGIVI